MKITIDSETYKVDENSQRQLELVMLLSYVDEQLLQKNNELAIADTARMAYLNALKSEAT